jgi:deazaflavin-dependent oxidoreductase (nitroreductase family)
MSDYNEWNKGVIDEFRANCGKVGGRYEGWDLLLLHTIGAKSGQPRVNPLVYTKDGDRFVIIASKGGAAKHPAWYHNLVANPEISVEVGEETLRAKAIVTAEPERTELFERMAESYPFFTEYQRKTDRVIPVIAIERQS